MESFISAVQFRSEDAAKLAVSAISLHACRGEIANAVFNVSDVASLILAQCGMRFFLPLQQVCHAWQHAVQRVVASWIVLEHEPSLEPELKYPTFITSTCAHHLMVGECNDQTSSAIRCFKPSLAEAAASEVFGTRWNGEQMARSSPLRHRIGRPTGLAVSERCVYVADAERGQVQRHIFGTLDSELLPVPTTLHPGSWSPFGLALGTVRADATDDGVSSTRELLVVVDSRHHRLVVLTVEEHLSGPKRPNECSFPCLPYAEVGEHGDETAVATFDHPRGVAVDSDGDSLVVADRGNCRLQFFSLRTRAFVRQVGREGSAPGHFLGPYDVAFAAGRLIVSEFEGRRLQVLTRGGAPLQVLSLPNADFCPTGIASSVDDAALYVAGFSVNTGHGRLHKFRLMSRSALTAEEVPVDADQGSIPPFPVHSGGTNPLVCGLRDGAGGKVP